MNAEPWKKWTPCHFRGTATTLREMEMPTIAEMLEAFAALLEAEQRGERCVLPKELGSEFVCYERKDGTWFAMMQHEFEEAEGSNQSEALINLARKLRAQ